MAMNCFCDFKQGFLHVKHILIFKYSSINVKACWYKGSASCHVLGERSLQNWNSKGSVGL
jgi:hypothetical protein